MVKCNHNCFECPHDDCIIETMSSEERKELRERDIMYFNADTSGSVVKQRARRAKYKGRYVSGRQILV